MLYQQRIPTCEAHQIFVASQALQFIPGSRVATPRDGEDWAVEWDIERDGTVIPNLHIGGKQGDFLVPVGGSAEVVPQAKFLAEWELPPLALQTSELRS